MSKPQAFTLLELLITSSITALLMLAISSLFITFLATAYRSRVSQNLRESGSNALNQMLSMIRNSSEISSVCEDGTPLSSLTLVGEDGQTSVILKQNNRIASMSANSTVYLTESNDHPNYVDNLLFTCLPTSEGKKYLGVSFTLNGGDVTAHSGARAASLDFSSGVATRN